MVSGQINPIQRPVLREGHGTTTLRGNSGLTDQQVDDLTHRALAALDRVGKVSKCLKAGISELKRQEAPSQREISELSGEFDRLDRIMSEISEEFNELVRLRGTPACEEHLERFLLRLNAYIERGVWSKPVGKKQEKLTVKPLSFVDQKKKLDGLYSAFVKGSNDSFERQLSRIIESRLAAVGHNEHFVLSVQGQPSWKIKLTLISGKGGQLTRREESWQAKGLDSMRLAWVSTGGLKEINRLRYTVSLEWAVYVPKSLKGVAHSAIQGLVDTIARLSLGSLAFKKRLQARLWPRGIVVD